MSEQLLTVFKLSLLGLLYLFFFRVLRAVWAELSPPPVPAGGDAPRRGPKRGAKREGRAQRKDEQRARKAGTQLVVVEPTAGAAFDLGAELTVGRGAGCPIRLEDDFVSQLHARVFRSDGGIVVEDLGSTNGTMLNGKPLGGPQPMRPGDRLQVGDTVMELR